jgi:hypothetical protein
MNKLRSDFKSRLAPGFSILVFDLDDGRCSVTNDAENVVPAVLEKYSPQALPIYYRDSEGWWDELQHVSGQFIGFGTLDEKQRARCREEWSRAAE